MRHLITTFLLMTGLVLGQAARADEAAEFAAMPELPAAQVMCMGEAPLPDMLRFAFQAEPEAGGRPEIIRVAASRRTTAGRAPAARPARQAAAARPVLFLPCIRG